MHKHKICISPVLLSSLLFFYFFLVFFGVADAETDFYWVTVNPIVPVSIIHLPVGQNFCFHFQAVWTYGSNSGQAIENAIVPIKVKTADNTLIETLTLKTNATGFISFNYSSQTPSILTFTPTKLITEDGMEWNQSLIGDAYGFRSGLVTIYWDSFNILLANVETGSLGIVRVTVNITYLMIPKEGLTITNDSQCKYIPKQVHNANVKINGIKAAEASTPGVYTAETLTLLPTAYILVEVSHEGWCQHKAFSFSHNANEVIWALAITLGLICTVAVLAYRFILSRRTKNNVLKIKTPTVGAILLMIISFISIYWALVGIESTLHEFNWMMLGIFGLIAFALGMLGSVMAKKENTLH